MAAFLEALVQGLSSGANFYADNLLSDLERKRKIKRQKEQDQNDFDFRTAQGAREQGRIENESARIDLSRDRFNQDTAFQQQSFLSDLSESQKPQSEKFNTLESLLASLIASGDPGGKIPQVEAQISNKRTSKTKTSDKPTSIDKLVAEMGIKAFLDARKVQDEPGDITSPFIQPPITPGTLDTLSQIGAGTFGSTDGIDPDAWGQQNIEGWDQASPEMKQRAIAAAKQKGLL